MIPPHEQAQSMRSPITPQVDFWRGDFGDAYTDRNAASPEQLQARRAMWAQILSHTLPAPPRSILEIGPNLGINLRALRALTSARLLAVEPNDKARQQLVDDKVVAPSDVRGGAASSIDLPRSSGRRSGEFPSPMLPGGPDGYGSARQT